jgi:hypothetical protein
LHAGTWKQAGVVGFDDLAGGILRDQGGLGDLALPEGIEAAVDTGL